MITEPPQSMTAVALVRQMARRFRPYRWPVAGSLVMVLGSAALTAVSPLLVQEIIDVALPERDGELLAILCAAMVVAGLLGSLLSVATVAVSNWIGQWVVADLRLEVYDRASAQPLPFYSDVGESEIQARLANDIDGVDSLITNTTQTVLRSTVVLIGVAGAMFILNWQLALASLAMALALAKLNNRFSRRRRVLAKERQRLLTTMMACAGEDMSLHGITVLRTLRGSIRQRLRFADVCHAIRRVTYRQRVAGSTALAVIGASFACIPPMIYFLAGTVMSGLSVGTVVVLVILQARLSSPLQSLLHLSGAVQASLAKFERIQEYLDLRTEDLGHAPVTLINGDATIRVREISYAYPAAQNSALQGITLDLPTESVTLITGHSGSGKSTLGLVLAGLLSPEGGRISVDRAGRVTANQIRSIATLAPQHTSLTDGSIMDNLKQARGDVTWDEVEHAIRAVQLDAMIDALPYGYDSHIGHHGYQLSGGERQRLGLARALLADTPILIIDEGTSALDGVTALQLHENLRAHFRGRSLVFIAHRLPRMESLDQVIVLDQGRISEQGTHGQLRDRDGPYAQLLRTQSGYSKLTDTRRKVQP